MSGAEARVVFVASASSPGSPIWVGFARGATTSVMYGDNDPIGQSDSPPLEPGNYVWGVMAVSLDPDLPDSGPLDLEGFEPEAFSMSASEVWDFTVPAYQRGRGLSFHGAFAAEHGSTVGWKLEEREGPQEGKRLVIRRPVVYRQGGRRVRGGHGSAAGTGAWSRQGEARTVRLRWQAGLRWQAHGARGGTARDSPSRGEVQAGQPGMAGEPTFA